jgi:hypothetical protein
VIEMMRTKLELQTAPNSQVCFGAMTKMLHSWDSYAEKVEKLLKPTEDEVIHWQFTFNWHVETAEEFEESEMSPTPLMFGRVSLHKKSNNWELGTYPYIIEFNFLGPVLHAYDGHYPSVSDEDLPGDIVRALRNKK